MNFAFVFIGKNYFRAYCVFFHPTTENVITPYTPTPSSPHPCIQLEDPPVTNVKQVRFSPLWQLTVDWLTFLPFQLPSINCTRQWMTSWLLMRGSKALWAYPLRLLDFLRVSFVLWRVVHGHMSVGTQRKISSFNAAALELQFPSPEGSTQQPHRLFSCHHPYLNVHKCFKN